MVKKKLKRLLEISLIVSGDDGEIADYPTLFPIFLKINKTNEVSPTINVGEKGESPAGQRPKGALARLVTQAF